MGIYGIMRYPGDHTDTTIVARGIKTEKQAQELVNSLEKTKTNEKAFYAVKKGSIYKRDYLTKW